MTSIEDKLIDNEDDTPDDSVARMGKGMMTMTSKELPCWYHPTLEGFLDFKRRDNCSVNVKGRQGHCLALDEWEEMNIVLPLKKYASVI
ncbi:Hypothetical predicted protein [Paramuricea clavata]|uniref:Uncharacterized protein n=1 Tax=Paramuricea clavata TaxID=317549 RepID=A0A6S7HQQ2_PARCT|nr:Hypothetical predicted protein [Paramuricea clavata]